MTGALARILERGPLPADVADQPQFACPLCQDRGYRHPPAAEGGLDYEAPLMLCDCRLSAWTASLPERLTRYWEQHSGVPAHFQQMRLEDHPNVLGHSNPFLFSRLVSGDYARASWYLWGGFGVGKTGAAVGYGWRYLHEVGGSVVFRTLPKLLAELRATYGRPARQYGDDDGAPTETEADVIRRYQTCGLLILDDLGAEQVSGSGWVEDRLYQVIGHRHDEDLPTVFTSNLSLVQVAQRIGERTTWRIAEMCGRENVVELQGRNLRKTWE